MIAFGNLKDQMNKVKQPFAYTGREWDKETGLYYYRARYYDPMAGRFISADPIGFGGGINVYAYVSNNPVNWVDPRGLEVTMVCRKVHDWRTDLAGGMKHCSVVVWHWGRDCDGNRRKVIDKQYSVAANRVPFKQGSDSYTYREDTKAFNNPGGENEHYFIPPPEGKIQKEFDQSVINAGDSYKSSEDYNAFWGPNSNTAADNLIESAGGIAPDVKGAWRQNYGE